MYTLRDFILKYFREFIPIKVFKGNEIVFQGMAQECQRDSLKSLMVKSISGPISSGVIVINCE